MSIETRPGGRMLLAAIPVSAYQMESIERGEKWGAYSKQDIGIQKHPEDLHRVEHGYDFQCTRMTGCARFPFYAKIR